MEAWLSQIHISCSGSFPLSTLQQQTRKKMEKSLCFLAGVLFLGGLLDAALMDDDVSTESYTIINEVSNTTTAGTVTVRNSTDPATPTTAPTKLSSTTGSNKQLESKKVSTDTEEETSKEQTSAEKDSREDGKTQLGRTRKLCLFVKQHIFVLIKEAGSN